MTSAVSYIARPETTTFIEDFGKALDAPDQGYSVYHMWGTGGVGKSTLTRELINTYRDRIGSATISFGITEGIDKPIPLMAKLYEQPQPQETWGDDPFWEKYDLYFQTIHELQTQAATGRGAATPEQVDQVKSLLQFGVDVAGEWGLSDEKKRFFGKAVDQGTDAIVAGLSLKDSVQQLLQQHKATRRDQALQKLMIEPLPQLTIAFAEGLAQLAAKQTVALVLDTYEKAPQVIDGWLWRTLLGNTDLREQPVQLVIAGRHCILRTEGWRKLQQDFDAVYERTIERFELPQTQEYLSEIGLADEAENIQRVTRGLPYYLNWIRQQTEKNQPLDFDQGNQAIVRLLLQGLNDTQKRVVQLAACCRQFDSKRVRYVVEKAGLDFATAVDEASNCFGWLTQQTFVEPVGKQWRLDDVARDVFQQSMETDEREETHGWLASYFEEKSEEETLPGQSPRQIYEIEEWWTLRIEYLYHLMLSGQRTAPTIWLSHLLEARYLRKDSVIKIPFTAIVAEFELANHPLLKPRNRKFLQQLRPAVEQGWAVLEEDPIDYRYNEENYGLSKRDIDDAVQLCLAQPDSFTGLAKFAALFYQASRCATSKRSYYLQIAQAQVEKNTAINDAELLSDIFLFSLGNKYFTLGRKEDAIDSYDKAIEFKPDYHQAWYNRGVALAALGRKEDAIDSYDKAIEFKPDD
ncbi:MAG: tetratricopeptide repeat protein, partial [Cyanobacteria bacterium J06629_9]